MNEPQLRFLDLEATIAKVHLGEGDKLAVFCDKPISREALHEMRRAFESFLPGVKVLIVPPGLRIAVLSGAQDSECKIEAQWVKPSVGTCAICGNELDNLIPGFGIYQHGGKEQKLCLPCGKASGATELRIAK